MPFYLTKCTNEKCEKNQEEKNIMCSHSDLEQKLIDGCPYCKEALTRVFTASGIKTSDNQGRLKT